MAPRGSEPCLYEGGRSGGLGRTLCAVADRKVRMASKTAGAAEKLNGGSGKMEDVAEKTEGAAKK